MRMIALVLGAGLAGALALAAHADPDATPTPSPPVAAPAAPLTVTRPDDDMMARRMARRAARLDESLTQLRSGLQLTSAQQALWPPVADAMRGLDAARGFRFRRTLAAADSQIDGLKLRGDHMARMGAAMGRLADATKPFVATLSPDQKSRLPALLRDVRPRKIVDRAFDVPRDSDASESGGAGPAAPGGDRMGGARTDAPGRSDTEEPERDGDE